MNNHPLTQAFFALFKQGKPGYSSASAGLGPMAIGCQYLTIEGNSCIIGLMLRPHLTADELANLFGGVVTFKDSQKRVNQKAWQVLERITTEAGVPYDMLHEAQQLHDEYALYHNQSQIDNKDFLKLAHKFSVLPYVRAAYNLSISASNQH